MSLFFKLLSIFALLALNAGNPLQAQTVSPYPSRPIKMIVPFDTGSGTDIVDRVVVQQMQTFLGQPVTIHA